MAHVLAIVALADYGETRAEEALERDEEGVRRRRPFRPLLPQPIEAPLTQQARVRARRTGRLVPFDRDAPAASALAPDMADVRPAITLRDGTRRWTVRRDLLNSGRFDADFVVEVEDDGRAYVRFGDGVAGRRPASEAAFTAQCRLGNGSTGNIGADAIVRLAVPNAGVAAVRNPLPATGAVDPHPIVQAKLYAPQAFRRQERAVTPQDYQTVAERHPEVQRAVATRRWTGSWHTIFITVDRRGGRDVDPAFERDLAGFLERYRLAGHDVEIAPPVFVPLDVALDVCARRDHFAADVKRRLLDVFSRGVLADGTRAFFHPDNVTFGGPIHLSTIVARAMQVPGVGSVVPVRFQRLGRTALSELHDGVLNLGPLEIARLDNDPNAPEHGRLELQVRGGA
jgi:predicted phage baseplate assembly protein